MHRLGLVSLIICVGLLVTGGAVAGKSSSKAITPSPVYTAAELGAPAGDNWLVHMGNLKGQRYSSLTQINKANVGTLKEAWHISLGVVPDEGRGVRLDGGERSRRRRRPLHAGAPLGDVFALDAATGASSGSGRPRTTPASTSAPVVAGPASRSAKARSSPARVTASSSPSTR